MFRLWSVIPATGECSENGSLSGWENTMVPIYSAAVTSKFCHILGHSLPWFSMLLSR
jgi:hypothetical protein